MVVFDLDGTLIKEEFLPLVGKLVGKEKEIAEITELGMQGVISFKDSIERRLKILGKIDATLIEKALKSCTITNGAKELIQELKTRKYCTAVATGSIRPLAEFISDKLDIDHFISNDVELSPIPVFKPP